jgi:cystathionine beta-lyase/cystathionine gamma-synthase
MTRDSTSSVHQGESPREERGSVSTPIYQTATFGFPKAEDVSKAVRGENGMYVYTRWDNPTVSRLEKKLAFFERTEDAAFFSSGMAAISTSVLSLVRTGDHVVAIRDLYGEAFRFITEFLPSFGVKTTLVDTTDLGQMKSAVTRGTKVVYIESPTNPTLKLVDVGAAARIAHAAGALLLIDNTFASPVNQRPMELGADLVLHSATKYINGHADVTAGAAAGGRTLVARIKTLRRTLGGTLDPHAAWLVLRGMKTMAVRVKVQNENAQALAEFLQGHRKVKKVNYPGLRVHPQHALAKRQMRGFGGVLSFELKGDLKDAMRFTDRVTIPTIAASLGGVETLISQPSVLSHHQVSAADKQKVGISETLIRVAVGIEDVDDLLSDFAKALVSV